MARANRGDLFSPDEVACLHVMNRAVRGCFLMGDDPISGRNFDHRKAWMETKIERQAAYFAIDLLGYTILDNHFHQVLRSRPDVVKTWSNTEVARRWLLLCPRRKRADGAPEEPNKQELNSIRNNGRKLKEIRRRLSDVSWWMRLLCQHVAQRANAESEESGKFWQDRFRAVRLLDETALLAAVAYVDLNPVRAALTEAIEASEFTSVKKRIEALLIQSAKICQPVRNQLSADNQDEGLVHLGNLTQATLGGNHDDAEPAELASRLSALRHVVAERLQLAARPEPCQLPDASLAPICIREGRDETLGPMPSFRGRRCSDKGFLNMNALEYIELLDWTARRLVLGKRGSTPPDAPPIFERLGIAAETWVGLTEQFGQLFYNVAGTPHSIANARSLERKGRYRVREQVKQVFYAV